MKRFFNQEYFIYYIVGIAILIRLFFYSGHVFSDDAYYGYLSYTMYKLDFAKDYIGYPHTPLRINVFILTALSFLFFGSTEFATTVFPILFSIGHIFLAYFFTKLVTDNQKTALIAAVLMAFFPTDIAFASINFADSPSAFFVNLGLYFLYKAHKQQAVKFSLISGVCFFLSIQFKVNIFFVALLLIILWIYTNYKSKTINYYIPIALSFIGLNLIVEGFIYLLTQDNFFYRFQQIELNSVYNRNEFFLLGSKFGYMTEADYWPELFKRIFILNPKDVYFRRFYLFLPLIALYQSFRFIKKKEYTWLAFWFLGLSLMFVGFTTSLVRYQPIILRLSWYMFPLFLPEVIIAAIFLTRFKVKIRTVLIVIYIAASLLMSHYYSVYFNVRQLDEFKSFIHDHPEKTIYTDHFTKYSIDLLDDYSEPLRTIRISGSDFSLNNLEKGEWIIYKPEHIYELKEQGHQFPDYSILDSNDFKKVFESGNFRVFEKL